jgi:MFS superfamily sulfate permease-like transporter
MIPTSALAAMLVYTGYKLVNPASVKELAKFGKGEVVVYLATVILIVVFDLLTGVLVGLLLAALRLLLSFSRLEAELELDEERNVARLHLRGAATFLRLPILAAELEKVPPGAEMHVVFDELEFIDHACLELLQSWSRRHEATGGPLNIEWENLQARYNGNHVGNGNGNGDAHSQAGNGKARGVA